MAQLAYSSSQDTARWNEYVWNHPRSTVYHLMGWRHIIEDTFGHQTFYMMALEDHRIVGILPLVLIKSLIFGKFLVSLPFLNYGGILADDETIERSLLQEAIEIAKRERVGHIELRDLEAKPLGLPTKNHKVSMVLDLPQEAAQLWQGFKSKLRSQIRKPQKEGLTTRLGGIEDLDHFYQVFAVNMRDLGTPVYSRKFFLTILRVFPENTRICTTFLRDQPVAAGFLISFKQQLEMPWASSLRQYNALSPNMLLYWAVLSYACDSGHQRFDFGRSSPNGGTYCFKEQWGAQPIQLYWQYWLRDGTQLPELNPQNPKYQGVIRIWQQVPIGLANLLGPRIVKYIP